jgi:hypothetical protein
MAVDEELFPAPLVGILTRLSLVFALMDAVVTTSMALKLRLL